MMFTVMLSRTFAFVIFLAFGCSTEDTTQLDIRRPGYDCEGKVANGTVLHDVGSSKYNCCYPVNCSGGDIKFCSEDLGRDKCIPCAGPRCNYKNISSQYVVKRDVEVCIEKCIYGTPVVKFDTPEQTRYRGDNVTITTIVKADNLVEHFYWSKDGTEIALNNTSDTNKYTVETSQNKISLSISDLHWSDTGIYSLVVTDSAGTSSNGSIKVNVVSCPLVTMATHGHADAGSTFVVLCKVYGNSLTTSMTFKHKKEQPRQWNVVYLHVGRIEYTIHNISSNDAGNYTCIAKNSEGKDEKVMYLSVYSKPKMKFPNDNRTFTFDAGDNISIPISVTYQPPLKDLICRRHDSAKLPFEGTPIIDGMWMIYDAAIANVQPHDSGNFTCKAENRLGTTHSELYIFVTPKEKLVRKDQQKTDGDCNQQKTEGDCNQQKTEGDCIWAAVLLGLSLLAFICSLAVVIRHKCRTCGSQEQHPKRTDFIKGSIFLMILAVANVALSAYSIKECETKIQVIIGLVLFFIIFPHLFYLIWAGQETASTGRQSNLVVSILHAVRGIFIAKNETESRSPPRGYISVNSNDRLEGSSRPPSVPNGELQNEESVSGDGQDVSSNDIQLTNMDTETPSNGTGDSQKSQEGTSASPGASNDDDISVDNAPGMLDGAAGMSDCAPGMSDGAPGLSDGASQRYCCIS